LEGQVRSTIQVAHDFKKRLKEAKASSLPQGARAAGGPSSDAEVQALKDELRKAKKGIEEARRDAIDCADAASVASSRVGELEHALARQTLSREEPASVCEREVACRRRERELELSNSSLEVKLAVLESASSFLGGSPEDTDLMIAWRIKEGIWLAEKKSLSNALSELGGAPSMGPMIADVRHESHVEELEFQRQELEAVFQEREKTVVREAVAVTEERMRHRTAGESELAQIHSRDSLSQANEALSVERAVSVEKTALIRDLQVKSLQPCCYPNPNPNPNPKSLIITLTPTRQAEASHLADSHSREIEKIKLRTERALERALVTGAEEAAKTWEEERCALLARVRSLQEETERRWSVEEAFTEAKRNDRPVMDLLFEKQATELQNQRLHSELAQAEERAEQFKLQLRRVEREWQAEEEAEGNPKKRLLGIQRISLRRLAAMFWRFVILSSVSNWAAGARRRAAKVCVAACGLVALRCRFQRDFCKAAYHEAATRLIARLCFHVWHKRPHVERSVEVGPPPGSLPPHPPCLCLPPSPPASPLSPYPLIPSV